MGLSVLGFQQAQTWGWASPWTWLCVGGGLAVLALFVVVELRTETPLLRLQIFRGRAFLVDNGVLFFSMIAFVPVFFFASVYSQVSMGYGASDAGLYLMVFFAGFAPAAQTGGRMLDNRGAKLPVVLGSALATVGFALWGLRLTELHLGAQWWAIVIAGAGIGFLLGPSSTDATNRAIGASYGEVTGITQTVRNYGSSLGFAVLGTLLANVFTNRLTDSLVGLGLPADPAQSIAASGSAPSGSDSAPPSVKEAISRAVQDDFAIATRWVPVGHGARARRHLFISLLHPGDRVGATDESPVDEPVTPNVPA